MISKKTKIIVFTLLILFVIFIIWIVWGNITIAKTQIDIYDKNIPISFNAFKIAQVSDLHNAEFGEDNGNLIEMLESESPDIITFTGDLVDSKHTDMNSAIDFVKQALEVAPCYFVTGNHEYWLGEKYEELESELIDCGVNVLRNQAVKLEKNGEDIQLIGVDDPNFTVKSMSDVLSEFTLDEYTVLLSHRPEIFDIYVKQNINLVLSGHAHGGQFRLPFIGGLVAPNYGLFPKYDSGKYTENNTVMIVSRGVGNSVIPVRFNNRPEIVFVSLYSENE